MNIGIITGSGFYDFPELENRSQKRMKTKFGSASLVTSQRKPHHLFFIARHGQHHERLPNMINYRANILALKQCQAQLVITTSIMGVLDETIPLARLLFFKDLYFMDNRLPSGESCSIFSQSGGQERGHYIFDTPFSQRAQKIAAEVAQQNQISSVSGLIYAYSSGPRFNTKTEINVLRQAGCSAVSQTAGPEIVLAGECEIACLLIGFGVDYANGVKDVPTPVEILNENMAQSKQVFSEMILGIVDCIGDKEGNFFDNGFVYRFG